MHLGSLALAQQAKHQQGTALLPQALSLMHPNQFSHVLAEPSLCIALEVVFQDVGTAAEPLLASRQLLNDEPQHLHSYHGFVPHVCSNLSQAPRGKRGSKLPGGRPHSHCGYVVQTPHDGLTSLTTGPKTASCSGGPQRFVLVGGWVDTTRGIQLAQVPHHIAVPKVGRPEEGSVVACARAHAAPCGQLTQVPHDV